ncbi:biofilm formation protein HmsH [Klebsiella pneumoniae]|uniref:Biofilm formation protein HmsH n=1 Tax=Klebsiella pneumoniae TaxID=573 RepID=A0A3S4H1Z7_KLEPN|nr:biofilm formation protein HmsH [Klebsiella pneumoniae]
MSPRLTRNAPYIRRLYGSPTPQPNDDWLTAQSLNVHYLAATNDLPQAEARMQRLAATAPGNQGLQIDYAALLQERGLPTGSRTPAKSGGISGTRQPAAGAPAGPGSPSICRSGGKWICWLTTSSPARHGI